MVITMYLIGGIILLIYFLIGLSLSYTAIKTVESLIEKYENNETIDVDDEEILNTYSQMNEFGYNSLLITVALTTMFWLPFLIIGWINKWRRTLKQ